MVRATERGEGAGRVPVLDVTVEEVERVVTSRGTGHVLLVARKGFPKAALVEIPCDKNSSIGRGGFQVVHVVPDHFCCVLGVGRGGDVHTDNEYVGKLSGKVVGACADCQNFG